MYKLFQRRHHQTAAKETDCLPINLSERRLRISEQTGHYRTTRHAGNHADFVEQLQIFECTECAEMKRDGA